MPDVVHALNDGLNPVGRCRFCGGPVVRNSYYIGGKGAVWYAECHRQISREDGVVAHGWSLSDDEILPLDIRPSITPLSEVGA